MISRQQMGMKNRMFDRYNVIDEQDLARAVAKRFANDKLTTSSEASKEQ